MTSPPTSCRYRHECRALARPHAAEVGVVVVGSPGYDRGELSSFFGCRQVWIVPDDPDLIEISRQVWSNRRVRRSPVWQAALSVAADVSVPVMYRVSSGPEVGS